MIFAIIILIFVLILISNTSVKNSTGEKISLFQKLNDVVFNLKLFDNQDINNFNDKLKAANEKEIDAK